MSVVLFGDQLTSTTNNTEICFIVEGNAKFRFEISEKKRYFILVYGPLNSIHGSRYRAPIIGDTENKLGGEKE